jgi:polyferredoxin
MFSGVVSTFMFLHALKNNSLTRTELFGVLAMVTSNLFRSWRAPFSVWTELGHGQQEERTKGNFSRKNNNMKNLFAPPAKTVYENSLCKIHFFHHLMNSL